MRAQLYLPGQPAKARACMVFMLEHPLDPPTWAAYCRPPQPPGPRLTCQRTEVLSTCDCSPGMLRLGLGSPRTTRTLLVRSSSVLFHSSRPHTVHRVRFLFLIVRYRFRKSVQCRASWLNGVRHAKIRTVGRKWNWAFWTKSHPHFRPTPRPNMDFASQWATSPLRAQYRFRSQP